MSRTRCRIWRPITWWACAATSGDTPSLFRISRPVRIGASGLRSSWASVARNSSLRRSASISRTLLSWSWRFTVASASVRSSTRCSRSASSRSRCVWKVSRRASRRQPRAARIIAKVITTAATASPRSRCRASTTRSCPSSSGRAKATTIRPGAIAGSRCAPRNRASACGDEASTPTLLAAIRVTVSTAIPGNAGASARREASNERARTASQLMAKVVPAPSRSTLSQTRPARGSAARLMARNTNDNAVTGDWRPATALSRGKSTPSHRSTSPPLRRWRTRRGSRRGSPRPARRAPAATIAPPRRIRRPRSPGRGRCTRTRTRNRAPSPATPARRQRARRAPPTSYRAPGQR